MMIELNPVLRCFAERAPLPVMVRAILERCLNAEQVNGWFERVAEAQYTRRLLFSSVFELMTQVVLRQQPSVHAACRAAVAEMECRSPRSTTSSTAWSRAPRRRWWAMRPNRRRR